MSAADFLAFQKRVYDELLNPPECWVLLASLKSDRNEAVALFDTKEQVIAYAQASRLPEEVRGIVIDGIVRTYRPDSCLWKYRPLVGAGDVAHRARMRDVLEGLSGLPVNPTLSRPIEEIVEELRAGLAAEALA